MTTTLRWYDITTIFLAFGSSLGITFWARRKFAKRGFQDHPTSRSLHLGVTPKVGGLGLLPSVCLALMANCMFRMGSQGEAEFSLAHYLRIIEWIAPAFLIYTVCLKNDHGHVEIPVTPRLLAFFLAGLSFVSVTFCTSYFSDQEAFINSLPALGFLPTPTKVVCIGVFAVISVVAFTNFYNFMDGIDGLAGSMGTIGFATLGTFAISNRADSTLGLSSFILSASCAGFLFWNWPKAKVFMGDTGSTFLGFSASVLGWIGAIDGLWHWSFPFLVFFPFWFDATSTLIRRLLRGEVIWRAHREHFYQRATMSIDSVSMDVRHFRVLVPSIFLMIFSSVVAFAENTRWLVQTNSQPWTALTVLVLIHGSVAYWVDARYQALIARTAFKKQ
jgi:UDP-N-acetylmuramyl pentapeptide phosphotransferase/UDP-N-acetylglucosamine-1-phosphate transferase